MKKKWLSALSLSIALVASGCGGDDKSNTAQNAANNENVPVPTFPAGSTLDQIQKRGNIKVGVKFDQPGFGVRGLNGQIEGFDVEIAKRLAQGIFGGTVAEVTPKVEFVEAISRNREPYIQNGTVDMVVATYTINDKRKQQVAFAGPYYIAGGDLLIKSDNTTITGVESLNGKDVCTAKGSTYPATLRSQAPQSRVLELDTYALCVEAMNDNRVEAVATDNVILAGFNGLNPGKFKLVGKFYTTEPYGIGVKKGDDALRNVLNDRLTAMYGNGSWKAAYDATFGQIGGPAPTPPPVDRYADTGNVVPATTAAPTGGSAGGSANSSTTSTTAATTTTAAGAGGTATTTASTMTTR